MLQTASRAKYHSPLAPPPQKKSSHRYRRHLYNHYTLLDVFVTTAGVPVVIFSA